MDMQEAPYNANDIEFLLSRGLDEVLSDADRARLSAATAEDRKLAEEVSRLRRLSALLRRFARDQVDVESSGFEQRVRTLIEGNVTPVRSADGDRVDQLLRRWGDESPNVDEGAFAGSVMREVRRSAVASPRWGRTLRVLGVPMAIAASIVFTVMLPLWFSSAARPVAVVEFGARFVGSARAQGGALESDVVYGKASAPDVVARAERSGVAYLSVGSDPMEPTSEEVPPI